MISLEPAMTRFRAFPPPAAAGGVSTLWYHRLDRVIAGLDRLPGMTEEKFLLVGSRLREISDSLRSITEKASEAAGIMSGEDALRVIAELEMLLLEMETYFVGANGNASRAGHSLGSILRELEQMSRLMSGFREQVGSLRMLKLLTNIQAAALAGKRGGFGNVAADIGALSQNVQKSSATILLRIKGVQEGLYQAVKLLESVSERQSHLGGMVIGSMRRDIEALSAMHGNCAGRAGEVSRESAAMFSEVGNLVVSLQFQDITRQQMEHAREAIAEVRGHGEEIQSGEAAGICALQSAQLSHTSGELQGAVRNITTSLRSLSRRSGDFASGIHGLFVLADEVGVSSIADMERGLASVAEALGENLETNRTLAGTMRAVTEAMADITEFAGEIDYIGSEIRLIALNAIIKGIQAGRDGAAFSVIAETVKRQSVEVCEQAAAVVEIIGSINTHLGELRLAIGENAGGDCLDEVGETLRSDGLADTLSLLKQFSGRVRQLLEETDLSSSSLLRCLEQALVVLDCREIETLLEREAIAPLDGVVRLLHLEGAEQGAKVSLPGIEALAGRYTMGSERQVHQKFAGAAQGGSHGATIPRRGEFGDNVELF